jgi:hypothetical protein
MDAGIPAREHGIAAGISASKALHNEGEKGGDEPPFFMRADS